jgi:hypothetical protein
MISIPLSIQFPEVSEKASKFLIKRAKGGFSELSSNAIDI